MKVPFNDPSRRYVSDPELIEKISEFVKTGPYLNGAHLQKFELDFAEYVGVRECVGVSSGTSALELAFLALDLPSGTEVLMNAHCGAYGSIAAIRANLIPRYFEILDNGLPDVNSLARNISSRTKVLLLTHLYGQSVDSEEILAVCKKAGLILIEDCAQSLGSKSQTSNLKSGSVGYISTFSFYPTKNLGTIGDAGAVCSANPIIISRLRALRQYGWDTRYFSEIKNGTNSRMDDLHAMVISHNLPKIDTFNQRRRDIWKIYNDVASKYGSSLFGSNDATFVAHLAVININEREEFIKYMSDKEIETSIHYPFPDYEQPSFAEYRNESQPVTDTFCRTIVSLPLYPELTNLEVDRIAAALESWFESKGEALDV